MLSNLSIAREFGRRFAHAADRARLALCEGQAEQEPAVTDRMIASIEAEFDNPERERFYWSAKTLTDRGRGSQESKYGADFLGVLRINFDGFRLTKGFLAQAKLFSRNSKADQRALAEQCKKMLRLSPASFVFVYSEESFWVIPAISVRAGSGSLHDHYTRGIQRFFEEHIECFIGDSNISAATPLGLEELAKQADARTAFYVTVADEPELE
jgi:hypothetical protein